MSLYAPPLSAKLILCGNRIYPYSPAQPRGALGQYTNSFGVIMGETGEQEDDEDLTLPSPSLFHGALQESCPIATWVGPKEPMLQFLEDEKDNLPVTYAAAAVNSALPTSPVQGQFSLTAPPSAASSSSTATTTSMSSSTATAAWASSLSTTTAAWASSSSAASPSRAPTTTTAHDRSLTEVSQNNNMSKCQIIDT